MNTSQLIHPPEIFAPAPKNFSGLPLALFVLILAAWCMPAAGQRIAVLTPEKNALSERFAAALETSLAGRVKVLDASLSEAAFLSIAPDKPFNLSTGEARLIGEAIGCDYFLLVKAVNQRRTSFARKEYFEAFAAVYLVSSQTGRLSLWRLLSFEDQSPQGAEQMLFDSVGNLTGAISGKIESARREELSGAPVPKIEELPDENSPAARNFRPPLPYKRLRPPYTDLANLYSIEATVDIEVDIDEKGNVLRTSIVRWAGFGLDEAVDETIRRMQWRPAERNGKSLPIRVLLRYNFRKPEKDE